MKSAVVAKHEPEMERDAVDTAPAEGAQAEISKSPDGEMPALTAPDLACALSRPSTPRFFVASLLLSLLLHAGLLAYLHRDYHTDDVGPGGFQLEAINVDLIPLSEWRSGAPNGIPDVGKDAIDQDHREQAEAARREETETPPPEGIVKPSQDDTSQLAAAETIKPDLAPERRDEQEKEKPDKPEEPDIVQDARGRAKHSQEATNALVKGGASIAATPGQISRYALDVQRTLNRNPPRHIGTRGRAVVRFGLTETGSVRFAEIEKSSGVKRLDDAVLATIWRITFPPPPNGMTENQRSYTAPVVFQ
jgi:TonB family protein